MSTPLPLGADIRPILKVELLAFTQVFVPLPAAKPILNRPVVAAVMFPLLVTVYVPFNVKFMFEMLVVTTSDEIVAVFSNPQAPDVEKVPDPLTVVEVVLKVMLLVPLNSPLFIKLVPNTDKVGAPEELNFPPELIFTFLTV